MNHLITPVILSGGSGKRLWPLSSSKRPKQFIRLADGSTLFEQTLARVTGGGFGLPMIVAGLPHLEALGAALAGRSADILVEPVGRDTAPAIAMAALALRARGKGDTLMLVLPSDHAISRPDAFRAAVEAAAPAALAGHLVTFGTRVDRPETGFGYIEPGKLIATPARSVVRFVEKPSAATAARMMDEGRHLWNAGIFLFRVDTSLDELGDYAPDVLLAAREAVGTAFVRDGIMVVDAGALARSPALSFDRAVLERSTRVAVVPMDAGWNDVGSWEAFAALERAPSTGNHDAPVLIGCDGVYVRSDGLRIAGIGLRDVIIVAEGDRVLILAKGHGQDVRRAADALPSLKQA